MGAGSPAESDDRSAFLAFYDDALPHVYGCLSARCGNQAVADDLTAETFLAAVEAACKAQPPPMSRAWILGVARHKLAGHWRRQVREERRLELLADFARSGHPLLPGPAAVLSSAKPQVAPHGTVSM